MIIIADSGSTKTTWCLQEQTGGGITTLQTSGINPFYQSESEICEQLEHEFTADFSHVSQIHFYGAGCSNAAVNVIVGSALHRFFGTEKIKIESDLAAAARALCQHEPGIACILGTGSNSCFYDGKKIATQVPPLGFILGDEGSGAVMGRRLLSDVLKNQLPDYVIQTFFETYAITQAEILENMYRKPFPNRYAAQFTRFLHDNLHEDSLRNLVASEFVRFIERNVLQYVQASSLPVHFSGSIAWYFREILVEAIHASGLQTGKIIREPMQELLKYHQLTT